jgi:hypothetical protein
VTNNAASIGADARGRADAPTVHAAGNAAMLQAYCPEIANAVYIGSRHNTGDAIRWGAQVGGALDRMTAY